LNQIPADGSNAPTMRLPRFLERSPAGDVTPDGVYRPRFRLRWLGPRHWPTWLGLGVMWLVARAPRRLRDRLARGLARLAWRYNPKRRRIMDINLRWCFPDLDEAARESMARGHLYLQMRSLLDLGVLWWGSRARLDRMVTIEGEEHIRECLNEGRAIILLNGHTVSIEAGAQALARRFPTGALFKRLRNPLLDYFVARGRSRLGGRLYPRERGIRPVMRALRGGELAYYSPDEDLGESQNTVFAPFFGVPRATLTALGRMARAGRAAVLPIMTYLDAATGTYRVVVDAPLEGFPTGDPVEDARRQNAELERMVRRAPEQYMWTFRLFQTRPPGEDNPYPYG